MAGQHWKTQNIDGVDFKYVDCATVGPARGEEWFTCFLCGLDFPRSKVRLVNGKAYGIPCTCVKDLASREKED